MMNNGILKGVTLGRGFPIVAFILAFIVMVLRRPDIITYAQPWAEDGRIWLSGIYNNGFWSTLLLPQNGYYQTISRLTYGFAILFGISKAALVSNIVAITIRCLLVSFILCSRLSDIALRYRIVAAVYILLMPNLAEGYVNITNIHWYLSLYLLIVLISTPPSTSLWKFHDFTLLIISGLSGPFIIFLAPCLIIKRIHENKKILEAIKKINIFDILMALCCMIQVVAILLSSDSTRSSATLGASLGILIKIISYRIIGGTFFESSKISFLPEHNLSCLIIFFAFLIPLCYHAIKGGWRFRASLVFPLLLIGFALAKPMISLTEPQWPILFTPGAGERYFFVTNFAFFTFCLYLISKLKHYNNIALVIFCVSSIVIISHSFKIPSNPNVGYNEDLVKFENAEPGERVILRINPPGWIMELNKK